MTRDDVHRAWTGDGRFARWVKPVLFAHLDEARIAQPLPSSPAWLRPVLEPLARRDDPYRSEARLDDIAVVVDLPGAASARVGVALVAHGFRPVPLYNAVPAKNAVVDLDPIMGALVDGAERVATVSPMAPPAFLLDADRMSGDKLVQPGAFDNRSVCRESDFPSADMLWQGGIRRGLVLVPTAIDLEPVLMSWQQRGIELFRREGDTAVPFVLRRSGWLIRTGHAIRRALLSRRNDDTYGLLVSTPSGS